MSFNRKPKSCVWKYFKLNINQNRGQCNYCQTFISSTAARFKHHLLRGCLLAPHSVKLIVMTENSNKKVSIYSIIN